jgi:hypothetical protein
LQGGIVGRLGSLKAETLSQWPCFISPLLPLLPKAYRRHSSC